MAKVAIMGYGTLGSGLAEVAHVNRESIAERLGEEVYVKYILDIRDFPDSPDADRFIKDSFNETAVLNLYAHGMNVISLVPFIALMLLVATLLTYSLLKLRGVESIASLGAMIKIIGSFTWFSGAISAVLTLIIAFIAGRSMISAWPLVLFFAALMIRSIIFALKETNLYIQQSEQPQAGQTEG
jgi:hypothetical protein